MILTVNTNHTCIEPQPQPPCQAKLPSWKSSRKALSSGEASPRLACSSLLRNWDLCNPGKPLRAVSWQTLHRSPEEEAEPAEFRENESKNANERVQRKAMKSYHIKWIINDQCVNEWIIASTVSANMGQNFNIPTNPMANKSRQSRLWALPWACWLSKCFTILSTVHVIGSPLTIINDQWSMRVLMVARPEPPSKSFFWSGGNSLMTTLQCSIFAKNWKTMKKNEKRTRQASGNSDMSRRDTWPRPSTIQVSKYNDNLFNGGSKQAFSHCQYQCPMPRQN